jgi:hypothetical protein
MSDWRIHFDESGWSSSAPRASVWILERLIAIGLALLLLRSAFAHLGNPYYFLSSVYSYRLSGIGAGICAAAVLPFLQLVVVVCLLTRWWLKESYVLGLCLFTLFTAAQGVTISRGLAISCGCFGASEAVQVGRETLTVTALAAAATVVGWLSTLFADHYCVPLFAPRIGESQREDVT